MEVSWWAEVENSLLSYLGDSEGYSLSTMQLSYDNLPDYLKPCLLYMGMFPEDARIPVSKLMRLWIAEGFVQNNESGRLMEEAAEGYLMDLIHSNVVMVLKTEYNGKVKYCQVHDLVLHFCLEKSREEKFMLAVKVHYNHFQLSDWKGSRMHFNFTDDLSMFASLGSKTQKPFHQHLRSLMTTIEGKLYNWNPFRQVREMRLLKVLDLSCFQLDYLSSAAFKPLIHLKYLTVYAAEFKFHPEPHLLHLETLIGNSREPNILIPESFWKMEKLRHVEITHSLHFDLENNKHGILEESSKLENLRILRNVVIDEADSVDVLLGRCPNLQQLYIIVYGEICLKLESLTQLQILTLSSRRLYPASNVSELQLPSNLKKLVLHAIHIESAISFIAGLPSLEHLQLWEPITRIHIRDWCPDITFHKLKFLKLLRLGIPRWDASEASFPLLETLVLRECDGLEEIPLSFADILTLKQIKLIRCNNKSLEASAMKIKEEAEYIQGSDRIDITIERPWVYRMHL